MRLILKSGLSKKIADGCGLYTGAPYSPEFSLLQGQMVILTSLLESIIDVINITVMLKD